jgi:hypothetical protein
LASERVARRLTAVLAADVAGYSRLVGNDEEGTLAQWKAHWHALIEPNIKEYHGRIVRVTGDGVLVEFASVVDAVRCAVEVQRGMATRNVDVPQDKRMGDDIVAHWHPVGATNDAEVAEVERAGRDLIAFVTMSVPNAKPAADRCLGICSRILIIYVKQGRRVHAACRDFTTQII